MTTLCEQLQGMVSNYFDTYPNVSINGLAKKSGIGATTIRRIIGNSIKGDPAPHTVLNLVSSISKEKRLGAIIDGCDGPIKELLKNFFGEYAVDIVDYSYDPDLNDVLTDSIKYLIYKLAANKVGTTKHKVREIFGKLGIDHLEDLMKTGHLLEKNGNIYAKEKNFSLDPELALRHLPSLLNFFKLEEATNNKNLFGSLSESLNEDGIRKVREIQNQAMGEIYNVMNSPYYEGDIPYFAVYCMDTMNPKENLGVMQ